MGNNSKGNSALIPVVATLFAAAAVLISSVTFGGPSFGKLWPAIPLVLFTTLSLTAFASDTGDWWPGATFVASLFLFWLLSNTEVIPFSRSWPFLLLIAGGLIVVTVMLAKKRKN